MREPATPPHLFAHLEKGAAVESPPPNRPRGKKSGNQRAFETQRDRQDFGSPGKSFSLENTRLFFRRVLSSGRPDDRTEHLHAARRFLAPESEVELSSHGGRIVLRLVRVSLKAPQGLKATPLLEESPNPVNRRTKGRTVIEKGGLEYVILRRQFPDRASELKSEPNR